jgi:mRNA-degrading endonuclease RelE of RelBE toxin-antitoxin system
MALMAKKKREKTDRPTSAFPGGLYRFVDIASFTQDWNDLGCGDDELRILEGEICRDPTRSPVVPGGGGARKIRLADPSSSKGKSGGLRVLYAFLADNGIVLLIAAWPKSEREDLAPQDYRAIGQLIARIRGLLEKGKIR